MLLWLVLRHPCLDFCGCCGFLAIIVIVPLLNQLGSQITWLWIVINLIFNLFTPSVGITGHSGGLVGGALQPIFLANKVEKSLILVKVGVLQPL